MYLGIDIGGTTIKIGLVDKQGNIFCKYTVKTLSKPEEVVDSIKDEISKLLKDRGLVLENIKGIGIGCPGTVDVKNGIIRFACNLNWHDVEFKKLFIEKTGYKGKFKIYNDARVATLAEARFGQGKDKNNLILLTLGTGVGGGIIVDGKLYEGALGMAGELGHITLVLDGEQCNCGRKGCVESYASATALIRQTKLAMENDKGSILWDYVSGDINKVDGKASFACAQKGDETAIKVVDKYIEYLGESILNYFNIFRPDMLVLAGGISNAGDILIDKIKTYVKDRFYGHRGTPSVEIVKSSLNDNAGIIGAAALVFD